MNSKERFKNRGFYFLMSTVISVILFRLIIIIEAWNRLKKKPIWDDAIYAPRKPIFSWQADENILLFGHFLSPVILLCALFVLVKMRKKYSAFFIFNLIIFIEILMRYSATYSYLLYD